MYNLLRKKNVTIKLANKLIIFGLLLTSAKSFAQKEQYLPNHDDKKYYIGIGVLYHSSRFQLTHDPMFFFFFAKRQYYVGEF